MASTASASSPSAPPSDPYYPQLPVEKYDHQDPPPPYNFAHELSSQKAHNQTTPQGSPQPVQPVSPHNVTTPSVTNQQPGSRPIVATTNQAQPVQVILQGDMGSPLAPGVCHICRKGKIKDSASCCSWVACCFLLPFGIIPGLIAFCYACRKPKCTRCGFVHGKKK